VAYLPYTARVIVTAADRERRQEYVRALTVQGASAWSISIRHVLRNIAALIASQSTVAFAYALIDLASLSFLGLAVQPPEADWGVLASDRDAVLQGHSTQVISASVLVVVTVLALFVLGARLGGERPTVRGYLRRKGAR
jgi:peptide/nickel transport system permease protein